MDGYLKTNRMMIHTHILSPMNASKRKNTFPVSCSNFKCKMCNEREAATFTALHFRYDTQKTPSEHMRSSLLLLWAERL